MLMPSHPRRAKPNHPAKDSGRRRGRPMKRESELKPNRKARMEYARVLHSHASTAMATSDAQDSQSLSALESLPVELIHHIFFHSFEVNMARASGHLARVLSQPSIYHSLVLFAYFDPLDDRLPVETHHFRPAEYRRISLDEQMRLQRGILGCRWFTLTLLKSCMPTLSRLQMVQAWHRERLAEMALGIPTDNPTLSPMRLSGVQNELLRAVAGLPALDDDPGLERHFLAKLDALSGIEVGHADAQQQQQQQQQQLQRDRPEATVVLGPTGDGGTLPRIMGWTSSSSTREDGQLHKTVDQGITILAARVLPDHIVRGSSWTDSKLELLQLLRQGMRFLVSDRILEISAAALFEGMASAIREGNAKALLVLLELHHATMRLDPAHDPQCFDGTVPRGKRHLATPFAHPLPIDLFYLAVKQKHPGPDPDATATATASEQTYSGELGHPQDTTTTTQMLTLLIREGIDSIHADDAVLTRWATYTWTHSPPDSQERRLSRWLLDYMSGTDDYGLGPGVPLFVNGSLSARRRRGREGAYPFPEMSFTQEIGYLCQGEPGEVVRARDGGPCG